MIRIDEIYDNTFWPWLEKNRPGFRFFYCFPFGRSDPESLKNLGRDDWHEHNYIVCFDQEPVDFVRHMPLFSEIIHRNSDILPPYDVDEFPNFIGPKCQGYLLTSERDSATVDLIEEKFGWKKLYYFYHGWAALDWYRGYDKTFLITPVDQRQPTRTFIAPNRIIAGERQHRLEMLYWIFKLGLTDNHISCPEICPVEKIHIYDAIKPLENRYPDIKDIFSAQQLPINFEGETDHPMHSCWLSLFAEAADSLLYLVTETVATGKRHHLTEKTFKPIALGMPFVISGTHGSLKYLRSYGFKTFGDIWDESYDDEPNDQLRIEKIAKLLKSLDDMGEDKLILFDSAKDIVKHNWDHFYNGGFEAILWDELQAMLNGIESSSGSSS